VDLYHNGTQALTRTPSAMSERLLITEGMLVRLERGPAVWGCCGGGRQGLTMSFRRLG
jgi:hypothetical protein